MVWSSAHESWAPAGTYGELQPEIAQAGGGRPTTLGGKTPDYPTWVAVGFVPRLGAYLVDWMVMNLVGMLLPENEGLKALAKGETIRPEQMESVAMHVLLGICLTAIYYVSMNGSLGATLGKLMIGARIVRLDGRPIGYGLAALRFVSAVLSWLSLGVGFLFIAFRPDRRALHDLLAGTQVVWRTPEARRMDS